MIGKERTLVDVKGSRVYCCLQVSSLLEGVIDMFGNAVTSLDCPFEML